MKPKPSPPSREPLFYGWILVFICLGNVTIGSGIASAFSVIFVTLLKEFGLSRADLSGVFSLYMILYFCGGVFIGPLLDRFGPRVLIPAGCTLIALGLFACGRISSPRQLYLFYGLVTGLGVCTIAWVPNSVIIANWFVRRRGTAVGITMCGNGIGMLIFIPLTQLLIKWYGWRGAFDLLAVLSVVLLAPLNAIFQRTRPEDMGLSPDSGSRRPEMAPSSGRPVPSGLPSGWAFSDVLRQRSFWMMCLAILCTPLVSYTITLHQMAFVVERGFDPMIVASFLGFVGVCAIIGRLAGGAASDKIGREWAFTVFYSCSILGIISLLFLKMESAWLLPVYVVFGGLGLGTGAAMYPAMLADLFPGPNLGKVMGFTSFFAGLGSGFGPIFVGYLHDLTGNYTSGLTFLLFPLVAAIFFVWIAAPRKARKTV